MEKKKNLDQDIPPLAVVRDLVVWVAPNRIAKNHDKEFYSTMIALAILFSIVLVFIKEFFLTGLIWFTVFFVYALDKFPVQDVQYKITTQGVVFMDKAYLWEALGPFWFVEKDGMAMLKVASRGLFGELTLLLGNTSKDEVRDALARYIPYWEVPEKTFADKASDWLASKFSLDKATAAGK